MTASWVSNRYSRRMWMEEAAEEPRPRWDSNPQSPDLESDFTPRPLIFQRVVNLAFVGNHIKNKLAPLFNILKKWHL